MSSVNTTIILIKKAFYVKKSSSLSFSKLGFYAKYLTHTCLSFRDLSPADYLEFPVVKNEALGSNLCLYEAGWVASCNFTSL
jgi:hypothetical protein